MKNFKLMRISITCRIIRQKSANASFTQSGKSWTLPCRASFNYQASTLENVKEDHSPLRKSDESIAIRIMGSQKFFFFFKNVTSRQGRALELLILPLTKMNF